MSRLTLPMVFADTLALRTRVTQLEVQLSAHELSLQSLNTRLARAFNMIQEAAAGFSTAKRHVEGLVACVRWLAVEFKAIQERWNPEPPTPPPPQLDLELGITEEELGDFLGPMLSWADLQSDIAALNALPVSAPQP